MTGLGSPSTPSSCSSRRSAPPSSAPPLAREGGGRPSATEIHPQWQGLTVGDQLRAWSPGGLLAPCEVAALEPDRFLGLHKLTDLRGRSLDRRPRPSAYMGGLWEFERATARGAPVLAPAPTGRR